MLNKNGLQLGDTLNCSGAESYKEGVKAFAKMKGNLPDAIYLSVTKKLLVLCIVQWMLVLKLRNYKLLVSIDTHFS